MESIRNRGGALAGGRPYVSQHSLERRSWRAGIAACTVAVLLAAAGLPDAGQAVTIAVLDNGSYVDTAGGSSSESDTIQASLTSLGHTVSTFTDISAAGLTTALAGTGILVIPELEAGDLNAGMTAPAKAVIASFVSAGGAVIESLGDTREANLLNSIFGFSVVPGTSSATSNRTPATTGTSYAAGPATLPGPSFTRGFTVASLPAGSLSAYEISGTSMVARMPYGLGRVILLGWDWFNAAPLGAQNGGWLTVLDAAVLDASSSVCGDGVTVGAEQCDDGNTLNGDCCSSTCQYEANTVVCRAAAGSCDVPETCTGASASCPADAKSFGVCRPAAGVCDVAESCDGASNSCPADAFAAGGECRPAAGICDVAESCDGSGPNCPADAFVTGGTCRAAAGICDLAETCDGSGADCPADAFVPDTVQCRAASPGEACDVAELCTGSAADCPADGFAAMGTPCRAAADQCDVGETCTGGSASCPVDLKQPDGTDCDDGDTCTQADVCQSGACTGADPLDCDDGDACTADACDPIGGCINDEAPATGCLTAGKALMLIKDASDDTKDKLLWKWIKGGAMAQTDLADPQNATSYALCVYAGTANALVARASLPPSASEWSTIGDKGYEFKGTSPNGLSLALLKGGAAGKSKALTKGKGAALPDPALPLAYPVKVQLKKDGGPLCLESTFTAANEKRNDAGQFKAKQ